MSVLNRTDRSRKVGELLRLVRFQRVAFGARDAIVSGQFERDTGTRGPGSAIIDVMSETLLARVEIDSGNTLPGLEECDRDMQRCRRFPRATFLVAEHDHIHMLACHILAVADGAFYRVNSGRAISMAGIAVAAVVAVAEVPII